jgi:hypothetical protein
MVVCHLTDTRGPVIVTVTSDNVMTSTATATAHNRRRLLSEAECGHESADTLELMTAALGVV